MGVTLSSRSTSSAFPTIVKKEDQPNRSGRLPPLRVALYSLLLIGALGVVGVWTSHAVWESIVHTYSANLTAILDADIAALDIWVKNEIDFSEAQASNPLIRKEVEGLITLHRADRGAIQKLVDSDHTRRLRELTKPLRSEQDYLGFLVLSGDGKILATSYGDVLVGKSLKREAHNRLETVFAGEALVQRPYMQGTYLPETVPLASRPFMVAAAPVYGVDGNVIAAFVRILDPDKDFTRILSVARMGKSGDTYAFDEEGYLISDSRFEEELKSIGLLPDEPEARSILTVQIRDPGGDMTSGYRSPLPLADRPLTRMAGSAVAGKSGVDISGYRDYRGVTVIGAWRWLPEFGFGVATEVRKRDAFVAQRPVKIAFLALFLLLVSACCWFLYSSISIHRLKDRIDEIKQLGQYRLLEKIGEGGMGKVFKAGHALLKRPTAVKFLRPEVMTGEMVMRFEREVQLTSSLTHPNTIQIFDYGKTESGVFYYAMEFLEGINLAQLVELDGPITESRVIHILKHVCYSLEEAHSIGLIHRDIKPMNIMLCKRGGQFDCIKVLDFGLAKEIEAGKDAELTVDQSILGTPVYIAPERLRGDHVVDIRSDFYALGAVAYKLLTGEDVFVAPTAVEVCYQVMKSNPIPPSERLGHPLPEALEGLVMNCLAKEKAARPTSARVIINILEEMEHHYVWGQEQAYTWWLANRDRLPTFDGEQHLA